MWPCVYLDDPGLLQHARHQRHRGPRRPEHHREEFVAEMKLVAADAIAGHQQPAAASLLYGMQRDARRGLHHEAQQGLCVALDAVGEGAVARHFLSELLDWHYFGAGVGHLNHGFADHQLASDERGDANGAFVADRRNLHHRAVLHAHRHGGDAAVQEVDIANGLVPRMERLFHRDWDRTQMIADPCEDPRPGSRRTSLFFGRASSGGGRTDIERFAMRPPDLNCLRSLGLSRLAVGGVRLGKRGAQPLVLRITLARR